MPFLSQKRVLQELKKYEKEKPFTERELKRVTKRNTGEFRREEVGKIVTTKEYRKAVFHAMNEHKIAKAEAPRLLNRWKKWLRQPYQDEGSSVAAQQLREQELRPQDRVSYLHEMHKQSSGNVAQQASARSAGHAAPSMAPPLLTRSVAPSETQADGAAQATSHQGSFSLPASASRPGSSIFNKILSFLFPPKPSHGEIPEKEDVQFEPQAILEKAEEHQRIAESMLVSHARPAASKATSKAPIDGREDSSAARPQRKSLAAAPAVQEVLAAPAQNSIAVSSSGQIEERKRFGARVAWWGLVFVLVILWWREIATFSLWWGSLGTMLGFLVGLFLLPLFPFLQVWRDDWVGAGFTLIWLVIAAGLFFYSLKETARLVRALLALRTRQRNKASLP